MADKPWWRDWRALPPGWDDRLQAARTSPLTRRQIWFHRSTPATFAVLATVLVLSGNWTLIFGLVGGAIATWVQLSPSQRAQVIGRKRGGHR